MRRTLVIGGTLFIGRELVRRLMERGDHVTILHRGKSQIPAGADEIL
jgi:nucleoside-diphosphate-sugar epimerase